ncbi:MAG: Rpn family recombination-promoting nuclease/putative transposase [Dorea sp.]
MNQDVNEKYYLNDSCRIADLLNGCFFRGNQYIAPEDVEEGNAQLIYIPEVQDLKALKNRQLAFGEHDLLHKIIRGANYFLFSVENQNYLDPSMVLRSLDYTVGQYMKQRHEIQKMHDREKDLKGDEFVSRFSLKDLLKPVAILVIYFGDDEWRGARTLHELLDWTDIPEEWKNMFADYRMHLIEIQKIENLEWFQSDLRLLFGFLQSKNDKEELRTFIKNNHDELSKVPEDLFMVMASLSKSRQLRNLGNARYDQWKGGEIDMCKEIQMFGFPYTY